MNLTQSSRRGEVVSSSFDFALRLQADPLRRADRRVDLVPLDGEDDSDLACERRAGRPSTLEPPRSLSVAIASGPPAERRDP